MPDREKVINALERCESYGYCEDVNCPYYKNTHCLELLRKDALTLLKEQEPVLSPSHLWETYSQTRHGECPKCGADINEYDNSKCCGRCGQAVKW